MRTDRVPFWERKRLIDMTHEEWESLCDHCGRCCLLKLQDHGGGDVHYTQVNCRLLDTDRCGCRDYANRFARVADCIQVDCSPATLGALPRSCAYRRLAEGRPLAWWHPLVSGDPQSVHDAGISVRGRCIDEAQVRAADLVTHIVEWPLLD